LIAYAGTGINTTPLVINPNDLNEPCTIGALTFSNFSYALNTGAFTTAVPDVATSFTQASPVVLLEFNPNLAAGSDLALEALVAGGINEVDLSFNGFGGTGDVNEVVCTIFTTNGTIGGPGGCPTADVLAVLNVNGSGTVTAAAGAACTGGCTATNVGGVAQVNFGNAVSSLWFFKDINSGNTSFSEVEESFGVPEPMTLSLLGVGLLGLGLLRKRMPK